jgi:hypothetical protein
LRRSDEGTLHLVGESRVIGAALRAEVEALADRIEGRAGQLGEGLSLHAQERETDTLSGHVYQLHVAAVFRHHQIAPRRHRNVFDTTELRDRVGRCRVTNAQHRRREVELVDAIVALGREEDLSTSHVPSPPLKRARGHLEPRGHLSGSGVGSSRSAT